jgi:hypothetical protein
VSKMKIQRFKEEAEAARIESEKNSVAEGNIRVRSSVNALLNSTDQLQTRSDLMTCLVTTQNTEKMRADHRNLQDKAAKKPLTSIDWKRRIPFRGIPIRR